ncbi:MAG: T9SS type A sorting domain-containing protein, partial [Bacteroidetes bacterium]|nr:T9SS type A sorting domain-containing protein [Bacteroidota bacterium]
TGYDSRRLATVVSLYSHLEDGSEQLGIQSREAFESGVKILLGFSSQIEAELEFEISIAIIEGENLEGATLYLIDNYTNEVTNLSEGAYGFKSNKGTFHNRFTLQFEGEVILGSLDNPLEAISVFPNPTDGLLNIISPDEPITGIEVYDVRGRKLNDIPVNSQGNYTIDISDLESSVYFITIITKNGSITKRIVKK